MLLSNLVWKLDVKSGDLVELPNSDGLRVLINPSCLERFIEEFGDHACIPQKAGPFKVRFNIPDFSEGRKAAEDRKSDWLMQYEEA